MWSRMHGPWGVLSLSKAAEDVCEAWCSLIWKDSHSGCHLGTGGHLSFFPFPSPACSLSCSASGQWKGEVTVFSSCGWTLPEASVSKWWAFVSRAVQGPKGPHQINLIFETISGTLEVLWTSSLVSSNIAFEYSSSLKKKKKEEQLNVWEVSGGPVVRTQGSHCQDPFLPFQGTKIPQAARWGQKNKKQWNVPAPHNYLFAFISVPL